LKEFDSEGGIQASKFVAAARILHADLKAAGNPRKDLAGRRLDFHSLR
jgi:hypothetical protein